jgi:hypothetical protein
MDLSPRLDLAASAQPAQRPRPPIWVVGVWPRMQSMRRALRCDGLIPAIMTPNREHAAITPEHVREVRAWLTEQGKGPDFDIVAEGETPAGDAAEAAAQVLPWEQAGATWWIESRWSPSVNNPRMGDARQRIAAGPPGSRG